VYLFKQVIGPLQLLHQLGRIALRIALDGIVKHVTDRLGTLAGRQLRPDAGVQLGRYVVTGECRPGSLASLERLG